MYKNIKTQLLFYVHKRSDYYSLLSNDKNPVKCSRPLGSDDVRETKVFVTPTEVAEALIVKING